MDNKKDILLSRQLLAIWLVGVLAVYFFIFLLSELVINDRAAVVLGSSSVVTNYSTGIIFTGLGYLTFAFSRRLFADETSRRAALAAGGVLYVISMSAILFFAPPSLFTVITCLCTLSMGYIGGFVHYHAAIALQGSEYTGRIVGVSYFLAIVLQYVGQRFAVMEWELLLCVAAGMALLFSVVLRPPRDWLFENPLPYERTPSAFPRELWLTVAIVALMSVVVGMFDGVLTSFHASGELNLAGWPRLFLGLGELLAGILYDARKRAYMPLFALCSSLISTLGIVLLYSAPTLSMSLFYFSAGFYVIYLTVVFLDLAPRTANPALWAGMGRASRSFLVGLTAAPSEWFFAAIDTKATIVINVLVFAIIIVLFWLKGDLIPAKPVKPEGSKKQAFDDFVAKYQFTPRETDVMEKILVSDEGVKEIAERINISERVLYRYLSSLYEKTGTKSRIALLQLFYGSNMSLEKDEKR